MSVRQRVFAVGFLVVLLSCADVLATNNKEGLTCELALSNNNVTVGDPLILKISFVNKSERELRLVVPDKREQSVESWIVLKTRMSMKKGKTDIDKTTTFMKEWVDMTQDAQLAAGKSLSYSIDIRRLFKIPFDEEGEYTFELEANGVKAEPLKFTIKKRENVILSRTITVPKEKDWEAIVEEQPMEKDDPSTTHFIVRQRFPGETYRDMILLKEKPIDLKVSDPNYHGRFFVWISEKGLHSIEPLKINFYRPGTKLPAEDYFTWERQGLASIEKIVCTESKEKRSTVDVTVTLKTKDGKSLDAVLRIETHKLRFLRSVESSK